MTDWEKRALGAIVSGNEEFMKFKKAQKNKRRLDQFVYRLFPSRKKTKTDVIDILISMMGEAEKRILEGKQGFVINKNFRRKITYLEILKQINEFSSEDRFPGQNSTIEIFAIAKSGKKINVRTVRGGEEINDMYLIKKASVEREKEMERIGMRFKPNGKEKKEVIEKFCRHLNNQRKRKKYQINLGYEIEYTGIYMEKYSRLFSEMGAISFVSGFDGTNMSGSSPEKDWHRLRENRLRINGFEGLKALEAMLSIMRYRCKLDINSGIHVHVDREYKLNNWEDLKYQDRWEKYPEIYKYLNKIYRIGCTAKAENLMKNMSRISGRYALGTIEFKMLQQSMDYKTTIIQIIASIEIARNLTENRKIDIELMKELARLQTEN